MSTPPTSVGSLWPAGIGVVKVRVPAALLKEQGTLLGQQTQGIVQGVVDSKTSVMDNSLVHTFYLVATPLNYRYELLTVRHGPTPYPATVRWNFKDTKANNEKEFLDALKGIFSQPETVDIVNGLLAQST